MMDIFERPPIGGCGLRFEGARQMFEGTRTIAEILDEGDTSGASPKVAKRRHLNRTHLLKQLRWISSEAAKAGGKGTR